MARVASGEGSLFGMLYLGGLVWVPSLQKVPINQSVALSSLSIAFLTCLHNEKLALAPFASAFASVISYPNFKTFFLHNME